MEKRGLTELAAWFGGCLIVLIAYLGALATHTDSGDLRSVLIGLVTAYAVRSIKGAADRDPPRPPSQSEERK